MKDTRWKSQKEGLKVEQASEACGVDASGRSLTSVGEPLHIIAGGAERRLGFRAFGDGDRRAAGENPAGATICQRIDVIEFNDNGTAMEDVTEMTLPMDSARCRSVVPGPEADLCSAVDEGTIHKLTPANRLQRPDPTAPLRLCFPLPPR